jgi:hypothetical protein
MGIIEAVWKPEEEAKEAAVGAPVEVDGVKAVLAEAKDGVKVVPSDGEANDTPSAKEVTTAEPKVDEPKADNA